MRVKSFLKPLLAPVTLALMIPLAGCEMPERHDVQKPALDGAAPPGPSGHALTDEQKMAEDVKLPTYGVAVLRAMEGQDVAGTLEFRGEAGGLKVTGKITGLTPGKHGFHIHEFGDLRSNDGKSAGDHFNPEGHEHGGLNSDQRHAGDLGNIEADANGEANVDIMVQGVPLHFVLGRAIVVHVGEDDLKSQPSGDAGGRAAVGVIGVGKETM